MAKLNKSLKSKLIFDVISIITFFSLDSSQQQLFDFNNISQVSNFDAFDCLFAIKLDTSKSKNSRIGYTFNKIDNNNKKDSLLFQDENNLLFFYFSKRKQSTKFNRRYIIELSTKKEQDIFIFFNTFIANSIDTFILDITTLKTTINKDFDN